jgi:hypothetical protein
MDSWPSAFVGFASGIAVTLVGALMATFLQRRHERRRRIEEGRFHIYMKVMELHSFYFLVSSAEVRQENVDPDLRKRIRSIAGEIADMLRSHDELREVPRLRPHPYGDGLHIRSRSIQGYGRGSQHARSFC